MRYHFEGDVRPEYAAMSATEAGEKFASIINRKRDLVEAFLILCELKAVIDKRQTEEGDFDWSKNPVYQERLAGPGNHTHRLKTDPAYAAECAEAEKRYWAELPQRQQAEAEAYGFNSYDDLIAHRMREPIH